MSNLDCIDQGESIDTHIVGVTGRTSALRSIVGGTKNAEGPLHTLVLSVLGVPSQLKMYNLDCWGPGESLDTNIVEVGEKTQNFEFPSKVP